MQYALPCSNFATLQTFSGNIIPTYWNKSILTLSKRPDLLAISILAEVVYWIRKSTTSYWQTSYMHFEKKFGFNKVNARRAFVRLEKLNILTRTFNTIEVRGQKYSNVLIIKLNQNHKLFANLFNKKLEDKEKNFSTPMDKSVTPSLQFCNDIYKDVNKENRSRSNESSFIKKVKKLENTVYETKKFVINKPAHNSRDNTDNQIGKATKLQKSESLKDKASKQTFEEDLGRKQQQLNQYIINNLPSDKNRKTISEFYPLGSREIDELNKIADREFSDNFINQLILRLAEKYPKHSFINLETFMKYMAKVLKNEMRQAPQVNNENFKFKDNEEKLAQEKYLEEIENSFCITPESKLKRKLVGILEPDVAYKFLKIARILQQGSEIIFRTHKTQVFDEKIKSKILESARQIYGKQIQQISILNHEDANSVNVIPSLSSSGKEDNGLGQGIWSLIRERLIKRFGEGADISWFSRVGAKENIEHKILDLKMPTPFFKEYIYQHYGHAIEKLCQEFGMRASYI